MFKSLRCAAKSLHCLTRGPENDLEKNDPCYIDMFLSSIQVIKEKERVRISVYVVKNVKRGRGYKQERGRDGEREEWVAGSQIYKKNIPSKSQQKRMKSQTPPI